MNVHALETVASGRLAAALARFETQFTYPLGPGGPLGSATAMTTCGSSGRLERHAASWRSVNRGSWGCLVRP